MKIADREVETGHFHKIASLPDSRLGMTEGDYEAHATDEAGETTRVKMGFEWLTRDIMVLRNALGDLDLPEAIRQAEEVARWEQADVVTADDEPVVFYDEGMRNNDALVVSENRTPILRPLERALGLAINAAAYTYQTQNRWVDVRHDTGYLMLRYQPGQYFKPHVDSARKDMLLAMRRLTVVVFLNEVEEGGELHFVRDHVKIKPEPGTLVIFPSGVTHPHESVEVAKGTKYAIVTWLV